MVHLHPSRLPQQHQREWFVKLGHVCDASLVVNTAHPPIYKELAVFHPGFWGVGFDEYVWRPVTPRPTNVPEIVFLANYWHWLAPQYTNRWRLAQAVADGVLRVQQRMQVPARDEVGEA